MGGEDDLRDPLHGRDARHADALHHRLRAVVHPREDMGMDVYESTDIRGSLFSLCTYSVHFTFQLFSSINAFFFIFRRYYILILSILQILFEYPEKFTGSLH